MEKSDPTAPGPGTRRLVPRRRLIGSRLFIHTALVLSLLLALAMIASLYLHWRRVQEPTTAIVVVGDPSWDNAEVVVEPVDDAQPGARRVQVVLDERNHFQTPIFELPGRYRVTVSMHDQLLHQYPVELERFRGVEINLPTPVEVRGDASMAGGRVLLSSKDQSEQRVLDAENHYRVVFPEQGGEYSLEVTRNGQLIDHAEFTVQSHVPKKIDLRRGS